MIGSAEIIDYTYNDFVNGIDSIVNQIKESDFNPDYIVGIVRGGAVPAVHLSHKLKIPVQMVHWSTRDLTDGWSNESNGWIPEDLIDGKRILIVDDIVDGGETIRELLEDWRLSVSGAGDLPLHNIRVCAIFYNTAQQTKVDYYDCTIDRNEDKRWVVLPWEA
jgi:hypoxanthine phosphoribosyltransferase